MSSKKRTFKAWTITVHPEHFDRFAIGRYWFGEPPPCMLGFEICAFKTREAADKAKAEMNPLTATSYKPRVQRIKVTIEEA